MSCSSSNAPIDISASKSSGKCELKCDYKFKYDDSSCIGKNMGDYISLSYDNSGTSSVFFNLINYNVSEVRLYYPSLHSFNGNKLDAELIIVHRSNMGNAPLLVCIPIRISNSASNSSVLFRNIITTMSKNAPSEGDETTIQVKNYNLSKIVPKKPFYSYNATEPFQPCSENVNYVVYDATDATLDISTDVFDTLKKIIKENYYTVKTETQFFYNVKGANTVTEDDIYIDCQPVGQSDETVNVVKDSSSETHYDFSWDNLKNNDLFKFVMAVFIFIAILYLINISFTLFKSVPSINIKSTYYDFNKK